LQEQEPLEEMVTELDADGRRISMSGFRISASSSFGMQSGRKKLASMGVQF